MASTTGHGWEWQHQRKQILAKKHMYTTCTLSSHGHVNRAAHEQSHSSKSNPSP
jgi:hypothetical protein